MMQPLREGTQVSDTVAAHGDPAGRWESQSAAAVSCHSVLLPERFGGLAAFHLRYPGIPGFSRAASAHSPARTAGA